MKILMIAGEIAPFAKTGGLGEVMESLPKALRELGHDVRLLMPLYGCIDTERFVLESVGRAEVDVCGETAPVEFWVSHQTPEVPVYFFGSERHFPAGGPIYDGWDGNRPYYAFSAAALKLPEVIDWTPDVIHVHDWHAGLVPNLARYLPPESPLRDTGVVLTIHNNAFVAMADQWNIPPHRRDLGTGAPTSDAAELPYLNFLQRGILHADVITTVSERYARELVSTKKNTDLEDKLEARLLKFFFIKKDRDFPRWKKEACRLLFAQPAPEAEAELEQATRGYFKLGADVNYERWKKNACELLFSESGHGLSDALKSRRASFFGVRNGVDYAQWSPDFGPGLSARYTAADLSGKAENKRQLQQEMGLDVEAGAPIMGMVARIAEQKGFSLLFNVFDQLMERGVQVAITGAGSQFYYDQLDALALKYPGRVAFWEGQATVERIGPLVYAGSDILLVPSLFEPSGLGQMVGLRYGTIPVVRRTGGLADTIFDYGTAGERGNGFVFDEYTGAALLTAVDRALALWRDQARWQALMVRAMNVCYSWEAPARRYAELYELARQRRAS